MTQVHIDVADDAVDSGSALHELLQRRFASRLFAGDATLWGPAAEAEASVRLGWTDVAPHAAPLIPEIEALRAEFVAAGIDRFVLCGMGGSSLAPAVITRWAGVPLVVLDSTHPAMVRRAIGDAEALARTAVIVSSKSGGTIETLSHLAAVETAFANAGIEASSRIVVVTDPGSSLERDSRLAGRRVFLADPNVGGRFSALTAFGLVPSGLAGADIRRLVSDAAGARDELMQDTEANPALQLAAYVCAGLPTRFVLATRSGADADWGLGQWIEQLIAESTGKDGSGVLPISLAPNAHEFGTADDRVLPVQLRQTSAVEGAGSGRLTDTDPMRGLSVAASLGAQLLLWEVVTAALGALMSVDPFNQPDVESAKVAARGLLNAPASEVEDSDDAAASPAATVAWLRAALPAGGYLAVQAFLDSGAAYVPKLAELREALAESLAAPVALCWGPSYLHSTGQLHKGGPAIGAYLQLVDAAMPAHPIPGAPHGFETLIEAQARGDRAVLSGRGRPVLTLRTEDVASLVDGLLVALRDRPSTSEV